MKIFKSDADYKYFLYILSKYKKKYEIEVITACPMPNHFHLLIRSEFDYKKIPKFMKDLQVSYSCYFNRTYRHKGHVFEGSYRHKEINSIEYLAQIIDYIAQNPVKDRLVKKSQDWPYLI